MNKQIITRDYEGTEIKFELINGESYVSILKNNANHKYRIKYKYKRNNQQRIILETNYGDCDLKYYNLLNGYLPSVRTAIDKDDYLKREISEIRKDLIIKKVYKHKNGNYHAIVENKYGKCDIDICQLRKGLNPSITTAIDKKAYFINKSRETHGYKYDYSDVNYINNKTKVCIKCNIHGYFYQTPDAHIRGEGCKKCNNTGGDGFYNLIMANRNKEEYINTNATVYEIHLWNSHESFYKIGITTVGIKKRFKNKLPYNYEIIKEYNTNLYEAIIIEDFYKNNLKNNKYIPKIKFDGYTECFEKIN